MGDDSRELVKQASQGDQPAIDELLVRHLPGLRAFIRLRAGPVIRRCESESDLAQSVCREVLLHVDGFHYGDERGFKNWLYTIALRKILNRHEYYGAAKRDRLRAESDGALAAAYRTFSTPSRHAMKREEIEGLERAFDQLGEGQREVITLAYLVGLSRGEIAEQLGKSEGAVRTLLSRSLAALAAILEPA